MAALNIVHLFINAANSHANEVAIIEGRRQVRYGELMKRVQATAFNFREKEISKNDKVLVFIPMKAELYVTMLALLYIGACPVFLDEWVSISRLKACLKTVPCKAIVASRKLLIISWLISPLQKLIKMIPCNHVFTSEFPVPVEISADDTALITFTTGSTGVPKAANRTHAFLEAQRNALLPLIENDYQATLTLLPVVVLLNLSVGKTNVLPVKKLIVQKTFSINYAMQLIQQHHIQSIIASPAITVAMAKRVVQQKIITGVKQIITGGGPVFPDDAQHILRAFPQAYALGVYGSTEAEPVSMIAMNDLVNTTAEIMQYKGLPVGALHPDIQIAIIPFTKLAVPDQSAEEWEYLKLPYRCSGEIVVSGPHVLQAYLNNPAAQQQNKFFVADTLWHRSGDEGILDNNNLYFRGRCTEVIYYKGIIIYPLIQAWLLQRKVPIPEAAILLLNDQLLVVLEQKSKKMEVQVLIALKDTALANATIRYLPSIPKDKRHHTKIDYEKLRKLLQ